MRSRQWLMMVLYVSVFPMERRVRAAPSPAGALYQAFKYLPKGADVRPQRVPVAAPQPQQYNAVSDNVVYAAAADALAGDSTGHVPFLRTYLADTPPEKGVVHLCFLSDAFRILRSDSRFLIRARDKDESERFVIRAPSGTNGVGAQCEGGRGRTVPL